MRGRNMFRMSFDSWQAEIVEEPVLFVFMRTHPLFMCIRLCSLVHINACPINFIIFSSLIFFFTLFFSSNMILMLLFLSFTGFTSFHEQGQCQSSLCMVEGLDKRYKGLGECGQFRAHHVFVFGRFHQRHSGAGAC